MSWVIKKLQHKVFERNTIRSSSIELRFHPILKVDDQELLTAFQDKIRLKFPEYRKENATNIIVDDRKEGELQVSNQLRHVFTDSIGKSFVISQGSINVSSGKHMARSEIINSFLFGYKIFNEIYGSLTPHRLGVRYINIINKEIISSDLQQAFSWENLIKEEFIHNPLNISGVNFKSQIITPVEDDGYLGLLYGLTQTKNNTPNHFVIDLDRFVEGDLNLSDLEQRLEGFASDIFSVFMRMIEIRLTDWMSIKDDLEEKTI